MNPSIRGLRHGATRLPPAARPASGAGCAPCGSGADGETRTPTANATAPSRQRVYQFHHVGFSDWCYFGTSPGFDSPPFAGAAGAVAGAAGAVPCGTSPGLLSLVSLAAGC